MIKEVLFTKTTKVPLWANWLLKCDKLNQYRELQEPGKYATKSFVFDTLEALEAKKKELKENYEFNDFTAFRRISDNDKEKIIWLELWFIGDELFSNNKYITWGN